MALSLAAAKFSLRLSNVQQNAFFFKSNGKKRVREEEEGETVNIQTGDELFRQAHKSYAGLRFL